MAQVAELFGLYDGASDLAVGALSGLKLDAGQAVSFPPLSAGPNDPAITYLGGVPGDVGPTYPRYLFDGVTNLTYDDGTRGGIGGTVAFRTDATSFDIATYAEGSPSDFRVYVDGKLANGDALDLPSDGSLRMVHVDLSALGLAPGMHQIDLVYPGTGAFGGVELPAGTSIAPIVQTGPRIVFLGDSFTEGTGSSSQAIDYAALTGRLLGTDDIWQSGFGGTGYVTPLSNRPNLETRIQSDGVSAQGDIYVVAMGINDGDDYAGIYAAARATLTTLSSGQPDAKIFVVADWNPSAPTGTIEPDGVAAIEAASAGLSNVVFLDPSNVLYTKVDPTHPDQAGHEVLAAWLTTQIRAATGADGVVEQNVAGDEVGPLFIQGWSAGEHYTYRVLEGGHVSTRFEVVDTGDAFPVLQLLPGQAIGSLGTIAVTVAIIDAEGRASSQVVSFDVRAHIEGTSGNDVLAGTGAGGVSIYGDAGNDTLTGTAGVDRLEGGAGNDTLIGGGAADELIGGAGDDTYVITDTTADVIEAPGGGTNTIRTGLTQFMLPDNVERLELTGSALVGGGNTLDNTIVGDALANQLYGNTGNDTLIGGGGNDALNGGAGIDTAVFTGPRADYTITATASGFVVTDSAAGRDGTDTLTGIERLQFADVLLQLPTGFTFGGDAHSDVLLLGAGATLQVVSPGGGSALETALTADATLSADLAQSARPVAAGDFNADGVTDLLYRETDGELIAAGQAPGNAAALTLAADLGDPGAAWAVVGTGDFTGDESSDILFLNAVTGVYASWSISGDALAGGGVIGAPGKDWVFKAAADFNGDGKDDVLFQRADGTLAIWTLDGTANTGGGTIGAPGAGWFFKGTGDFNRDGKADLLFENAAGTYATWDLGGTKIIGGGTLGNPGADAHFAGIGDYNGDGFSDILFERPDGTIAAWLLDDTAVLATWALGQAVNAQPLTGSQGGAAFADLVFQDHATGAVATWLVGSDTVAGGATLGTAGAGWTALATGDFAGTGETDVLFVDGGGAYASWTSNGASLLGGGTIGSASGYGFVALADFNGDGRSDMLFQSAATGAYAVWELDGAAIVGGGTIGVAAGFAFVAAADLNGDGKADLVFRNTATGDYAAWLMDGTAIAGGDAIGNPGSGWIFKGAGDVNGDGKADLVFENASGTYAVWEMDGTAVIGGGVIGSAGGPGAGWQLAKVVDLNQDGKADLLLVDASGHYASWLLSGTTVIGAGTLGAIAGNLHLI